MDFAHNSILLPKRTDASEITEQEHKEAWAVFVELGRLRSDRAECAASCGCGNDPIQVIVNALRSARSEVLPAESREY